MKDYKLATTKQFRDLFGGCLANHNIRARNISVRRVPNSNVFDWYFPKINFGTIQFNRENVRYVTFYFDYKDYEHTSFDPAVKEFELMCELGKIARDLRFNRPSVYTVAFTNFCEIGN